MDSAERVTRLDSYSKRWNPIFETDRHIKVDGSFVDNKRKLNSRSDEISIHFRDDEDEGLYTPVPKELIAFCKSANISDLGSQTTTPRRGGWLDDREYGTGRFRRYQNPLAANHLLRHLQKPRFKKTTTASTDSIVGANSSCIKTSCTPDMNFTDQLGEEGRSSADDGGSVAMGLDQNECTQSYMGEAKSFQRVQTGDTERTLHAGIGFEAEEFSEVQPNCTNSDGLLHTDANDSADGDRRLICIEDVDPYYALALAEAASGMQIHTLRDTLWKHLALQTSLKVTILTTGVEQYVLEFHLPHFALRQKPPTPKNFGQPNVHARLPREWIDLSFLETFTTDEDPNAPLGIQDVQYSLAIVGPDSRRYVGYGFIDTLFDDDGPEEQLFEYGSCHLNDDPIAGNGTVDANLPIWDPREYFLRILGIRVAEILEQWISIVRRVEMSIDRHKYDDYDTVSTPSSSRQTNDTTAALNWTIRTMNVLRKLQNRLSKTTEVWKRFSKNGGDINYFWDIKSQRAQSLLNNIGRTFEKLDDLEHDLGGLRGSCKELSEILQLRLSHENHRAILQSNLLILKNNERLKESNGLLLTTCKAAEHNSLTAGVTLSIISPTALVIAYFSIQTEVVPFAHMKRNSTSFVLSIILTIAFMKLLVVCISIFNAKAQEGQWGEKLLARLRGLVSPKTETPQDVELAELAQVVSHGSFNPSKLQVGS